MYPATAALAIGDNRLMNEARSVLESLPVRVTAECGNAASWAIFRAALDAEHPSVLLLDTGLPNSDLAETIRVFRTSLPSTAIAVLHPNSDSDAILAAMRAGATEFLYPPLTQQLPGALSRMAAVNPSASVVHRGKLFGFVAAKGGCGATTVVCHVADEIRKQTNKDVFLGDLDIAGGNASFLMKTPGRYSMSDAAESLARLDPDLWSAMTGKARNGVKMLTELQPLTNHDLAFREIPRLLRFIRTQHDFAVLDFGRGLSPHALASVEELDELFIISTLDVPALHSVKNIVRQLKLSAMDVNKVQLILNRMPKATEISSGEIEKILDRQLYAMLPDESDAIHQAYLQGTLLPASSRLSRHLARLATKLSGMESQPVKKKFSLFS